MWGRGLKKIKYDLIIFQSDKFNSDFFLFLHKNIFIALFEAAWDAFNETRRNRRVL